MNQDFFYVSGENSTIKLYILADGMGGYKGGEIASKVAVKTSSKYISDNINFIDKKRAGNVPKNITKYSQDI
jgi:serine/threonine protein phosphatase PrpC